MRLNRGQRAIAMAALIAVLALAVATVAWFRTLPSAPRSISNDLPGTYLDDYVTLGLDHYANNAKRSDVFDTVSYTHTPGACHVEGRLVTRNDVGGLFFSGAPGVPARHFTIDTSRSKFLVIVVHADQLVKCRITRANYHLHHWGIPTTRSFDFQLNVDVTHPGTGPNATPYQR
jgi:hypothetical protein